jgi:post-segregation antitoxin (ccd killing protein)
MAKPGTQVTCYLPPEIRRRGAAAGLNFSGLLRRAIVTELARLDVERAAAAGSGGTEPAAADTA